MMTQKELDEIRRAVRHRRHLSWGTLEKLCATAQKAMPRNDTFTVTAPPFKVHQEIQKDAAKPWAQASIEQYIRLLETAKKQEQLDAYFAGSMDSWFKEYRKG